MQHKASIAAAAILLAALSGCSKPEPAAEATSSAAAAPVAAATWTPALPTPGAYAVSSATGEALAKVSIEADYSYSQTPTKGLAEAGIVKLTLRQRQADAVLHRKRARRRWQLHRD
jgi:hypothetical protein